MTPVDQTEFGHKRGNCFSACVASLMGLPIDDVPWFMGGVTPWQDQVNTWLRPRGYYVLVFIIQDREVYDRENLWPQGFYILSGKSPRGVGEHSVVARGKDIVHDPHPSRAGIGEVTDLAIIVPTWAAWPPAEFPGDAAPTDPRGPGIVGSHWVQPSPLVASRPRNAVTSAAPPPDKATTCSRCGRELGSYPMTPPIFCGTCMDTTDDLAAARERRDGTPISLDSRVDPSGAVVLDIDLGAPPEPRKR